MLTPQRDAEGRARSALATHAPINDDTSPNGTRDEKVWEKRENFLSAKYPLGPQAPGMTHGKGTRPPNCTASKGGEDRDLSWSRTARYVGFGRNF